MVLYVGLWLSEVRRQFPDHEDFKESLADRYGNNTKPTTPWWTDMRNGLLKSAQKHQMSLGEDFQFGVDTIHPMYKNNGKHHSTSRVCH
jgi:hypothetical protein